MVSLRTSAVLCLGVCGVYAAEQGRLTQITTSGASAAVDLARETIVPRKLRGTKLPPHWGQLGGLAEYEGEPLTPGSSPTVCMALCDANSDCNSFSYFPNECFLKDRVFTGNEAVTTSSCSDCLTYYKIKDTTTTATPAPTKKKCLKLADLPPPWNFEREYDPETEQCCGEGVYGTPTVCSKDMGCCVGGFTGTAKCFDRSSQQCCGTVSEMPVVCGLVGCPPSFSWECPAVIAAVAVVNSSSSDAMVQRGRQPSSSHSVASARHAMPTKEEFRADFKAIEGPVELKDWCGAFKDLFSPDDTNPDSRRFIDEIEPGVLSISADTGAEKWGRKFDPTTSTNPTLTETGEACSRMTNFESKIPADAPEELKAQVANGALTFTVTMGQSLGKKVLKWNGPYNGEGGPFLPAGGDVPANDWDKVWEYVD